MFIIVDANNIVQDIATEKANLSRGYNYPGYKLYENVTVGDIQVGDTFDGKAVTANSPERNKQRQLDIQRQLLMLQLEKANAEKVGQPLIAAIVNEDITKCQKELATLSSLQA